MFGRFNIPPCSGPFFSVFSFIILTYFYMFAIAFDMDTTKMNAQFRASYTNKYTEIKNFLASEGFHWKQGSLYYGDKDTTTIGKPFLVVRRLSKQMPWFRDCVKDIRVLKIEDDDDLIPHLE